MPYRKKPRSPARAAPGRAAGLFGGAGGRQGGPAPPWDRAGLPEPGTGCRRES
jgi:hypothetical protein